MFNPSNPFERYGELKRQESKIKAQLDALKPEIIEKTEESGGIVELKDGRKIVWVGNRTWRYPAYVESKIEYFKKEIKAVQGSYQLRFPNRYDVSPTVRVDKATK